MNDLFKLKDDEMLLAVPSFKLKGKAKYVFQMLNIMANTELMGTDLYWWLVRSDIIAKDKDKQPLPDISLRLN